MKALMALALMLSASPVLAECYQLYRGGQLISQSDRPPFDISYDPQTGPSAAFRAMRQRGQHLVFFPSSCTAPARGGGHGIPSVLRSRDRSPVGTTSTGAGYARPRASGGGSVQIR